MSLVLCGNEGNQAEGTGEGSCCTQERREKKKAKGKKKASSSAPKAVGKGVPKRKANEKDDHPLKKASVTLKDKLPKKSSPPKPSHEAGKGLMTLSGPVTQGPDHCLLTHKDYAIEMIKLIIKDKDVDPYANQMTKELGAAGLFELAQVRFFLSIFLQLFIIQWLTVVLLCRGWSV